jgi:nicotinate-nucleotide adenylyltransferase
LKIAIFGGSFDPPHKGHELIVKEALKCLDIDKLLVIPTYLNPFKHTFFLEPTLRLTLLQKLFFNEKRVEICDYEVRQKKAVFTIETVKYLKTLYECEKIYLIIGQDNLEKLPKWKGFDELQHCVEFVVATRFASKDAQFTGHFKRIEIDVDASSTQIRQSSDVSQLPCTIKDDVVSLLKKGKKNLKNRIDKIVAILDNKKAENIEVIDLKQSDYLVDSVIVASTLNPKHAMALLNFLKEELKPDGEEFLRVDEDEDWTVIDLGDIFIHLMSTNYREKYSIEEFLKELPKNKS